MSEQKKLRLLVVDDDTSMTALVQRHLELAFSETIEVTAMSDPNAAIDWIESNCCDIVISDIEMPRISGLDILRSTKRQNAWTQVVFLTGASTWERIAEAIEQGASDYLLKPINQEELISVVSSLAERILRWRAALRDSVVVLTV